jgi:hypothetical protein
MNRDIKIQDSRFKIQDSRFKMQDARFKMQVARFKFQVARCKGMRIDDFHTRKGNEFNMPPL